MAKSEYELVREAIIEMKQVHATYDGWHRKMCPHVIGTKKGKPYALFYQFAGGSKRRLPPNGAWRCMEISKLTDVSIHDGPWHTGDSHKARNTCVDRIDEEVKHQRDHWDVFMSHATEDKEEVARPLTESLKEIGVSTWYDETELSLGDSLRRSIATGISQSDFSVVILSHHFFSKPWPQHELDTIMSLFIENQQRILPVWHNMSKDEILSEYPPIADIMSCDTARHTIEEIADKIAEAIRKRNYG